MSVGSFSVLTANDINGNQFRAPSNLSRTIAVEDVLLESSTAVGGDLTWNSRWTSALYLRGIIE